jgi:uncharacterized protein YjdB
MKKQRAEFSLWSAGVVLLLASLSTGSLAAANSGGFSGFYDLSNVRHTGDEYRMTFIARVFNFSGADVRDAVFLLEDHLLSGKSYATFRVASIANGASVLLSSAVTIPAPVYDWWQKRGPAFVVEFKAGGERSILQTVYLTRGVVSVSVTPPTPALLVGSTQQFTATVTGSSRGAVTWSANSLPGGNTTVGTISTSGLYTAPPTVPAGSSTVTIAATSQADPSIRGTASVSLSYPVPTVSSISPSSAIMDSGALTIVVQGSNFTPASSVNFGPTPLVTVFVSSSQLTATVPATALAAMGTFPVEVSNPSPGGGAAPTPAQFQVNPGLISILVTLLNPTLTVGQTEQVTATGAYRDGSTKDITSMVSWTSSNTLAATISPAGLATAINAGQTTIGASLYGVSGSSILAIQAKVLTSINVTPQNLTLFLNTQQQFVAVGAYNDGSAQDLTGTAQWTSSAPAYATVSSTGLVSGIAAGNASILASSGSVSSSATVTVSASSSGITIVNDLTDNHLMNYWPGDGSIVSYYGGRNPDGTLAAITSAQVTPANQQSQLITFDSQNRLSSGMLSDGTSFSVNWSLPASPVLTIVSADNTSVAVIPLNSGTAGAATALADISRSARVGRAAAPRPEATSSTTPVTGAFVDVTTDCGSGPMPEDDATVYVNVNYQLGGGPGPMWAPSLGPDTGEYYVSLPSGPASVTPSALGSSAAAAISNMCSFVVNLPVAACLDFAPECIAFQKAISQACLVQDAMTAGANAFFATVNELNNLLPPTVTADVTFNGMEPVAATFTGFNYNSYLFAAGPLPCNVAKVLVYPNPASVSVGGSVPLGAYAVDSNSKIIKSSVLRWSWTPSPGDSYLQVSPLGASTPNGYQAYGLGVAIANVQGEEPTPTGSPDQVTATETNSTKSGNSQVTVFATYNIGYIIFGENGLGGYVWSPPNVGLEVWDVSGSPGGAAVPSCSTTYPVCTPLVFSNGILTVTAADGTVSSEPFSLSLDENGYTWSGFGSAAANEITSVSVTGSFSPTTLTLVDGTVVNSSGCFIGTLVPPSGSSVLQGVQLANLTTTACAGTGE